MRTATVNWTDFTFADDGSACEPRPHPWHGKRVVVVRAAEHVRDAMECELEGDTTPHEKRLIVAVPERKLAN